MKEMKYHYLPSVNESLNPAKPPESIHGDSPCPCCGNITIPNGGDALAYICPVCLWEIDLFLSSGEEASDLNHGLTLQQAQQNYRECGAVLPRLKQYSRPPLENEIPPHKKDETL